MLRRFLKLPKNKSFFLFGPRQTGKSTLIRSTFSGGSLLVYDLLRTDEFMRLVENPSLLREEVLARSKEIRHVFIDEIQRIPELLNEVHFLMESRSNALPPPFFLLTGSSARKLKRSHANLLGGRAWTLKLFPLTHSEIGDDFSLVKALDVGTLPSVYLEEERHSATQTLKSYVETYLKEEIEAEALVRSTGTFLRFLSQAGHESGATINYSAIARETGTSSVTVKEYYKILEDTLIGFFLLPFHKSPRKRLAQHPKFYLFDGGVQRALTKKLSLEMKPGTSEFGHAFESWVINETIRISEYLGLDLQFSYFRTERGAELDLIIETPRGKIFGIEIKSSPSPQFSELRVGMKAFCEIVPKAQFFCVCRAPHSRKGEGIEIMPWQDFFKWLSGGFLS